MCCLRISASVWLHRNVRRRPSEQHWLASSAHLLCRSAGLGQRRLILPLSILPSLPFALLASIFPTPGLPFHPSRNQPPSKVSEMQCQARTRPAKWISVFVAKQLGSAGFHYKSKSHSVLQLSRLWKEAGCVGGSPPRPPPHLYVSLSTQKQGIVPSWELVVSFVVSWLLPLETVLTLQPPPTPLCDQWNRYQSGRLQPLLKLTPSSTHRMVPEGLGLMAFDHRCLWLLSSPTLSMKPLCLFSSHIRRLFPVCLNKDKLCRRSNGVLSKGRGQEGDFTGFSNADLTVATLLWLKWCSLLASYRGANGFETAPF